MSKLEVPPLTEPRIAERPVVAERTLSSGLRVLALRRSAVPLVEVRLRVPFAAVDQEFLPQATVLGNTLLSGTTELTNVQIAAALQSVGGGLSVGIDPDRLVVSGNALADGLPRLLAVLAEVLTNATYPEREVRTERERLADRIQMALSQPSHVVRTALLKRVYGDHPYGAETPEPDEVRAVVADELRTAHAGRVLPAGSVLIVVGDVDPDAALDAVESALTPWQATGTATATPPAPSPTPGPLLLVDRPGSVQSSIRVALPAVQRAHADYPAMQLANLIFGGYFSSRLVENIREDKGYTYSPHSTIDHSAAGSILVVDADVATEVTGPSLLEINYELGRMATLAPTEAELDQARQYAIGTLSLSVASQSGLAGTLAALVGTGLGLDWLAEHPQRLAKVTLDDVTAAAAEYLAPAKAATVVLADATAVERNVAVLGPVSRA